MRLRGRLALWFSLAALVPIAAAAVVTRDVVSRSYKHEYQLARAAAEQAARRELARVEALVVGSVEALASIDHHLVGGLLLEMHKTGGEVTPPVLRELKERSPPIMRGLGLDVMSLVDASDVVLAAPHYHDAIGDVDRRAMERARRGAPYYGREPTIAGDEVRELLVVSSARVVRDGTLRLAVVGGREVGADLLAALRQPERVDARIVAADGAPLHPAAEPWPELSSVAPMALPLFGPDGEQVARLEVVVSDAELERVLREVTVAAAVLGGAALLATVLLALVIARRMTRDLDELVVGAQAASRGDLDHRVEVRGRDEIGAVADSFNTMMEDLRTSKERLVIAERVAAWQEIARRLAHEIKNPLTPIQMSVETIRKTWRGKHPSFDEIFEESTATVLEETARLKRIVGEFSEFARMPKPEAGPCDLNEIVAGTVSLYQGAGEVEVVKRLAEGLPAIEADRDQLAQVLLNLIENARDALMLRTGGPAGGRVVVETRRGERHGTVELAVEDNGPGVPPEVREKLFTPYFTTKHGKGGSGLGLAIVHRIASDHGGRVIAKEAAAGGARFVVELPVATP